MEVLKGALSPNPESAPNAVVTLRGRSVTREAVAEPQGKFSFLFLPSGVYELSAEMPSRAPGTGVERLETAPTRVELDRNRGGNRWQGLTLRADLVAIRGRITDVHGRPVAGAKITAIEDIDDPSNMFSPKTYSTVSNADGSYQLPGLEPTHVHLVAGYLNGGSSKNLQRFDICVEADGLVQANENVPRVPLVAEEQLDLARRLLKAFSQLATRLGSDDKIGEKEGRASFPSSHGNAITGIDIVLDPAGTEVR